jgi:inhibitor of KinA
MTIVPYGDRAVLINFKQVIDAQINAEVIALTNAITSTNENGVTYCIPAYCSVTVGFNPEQIQYDALADKINTIYKKINNKAEAIKSRKINIPVCYQGDFAIDRADVIHQTQLTWEEIIYLHTSTEYRVYMLGFIAGFAYMGKLPEALSCHRKKNPRAHIPSGTVGIAGLQTGIYPTRAHAGWQLIGRTPIPVFDSKSENPFLFRTGDIVQFHAVEPARYTALIAEVASGKFDMNSVIKHD